MNYHTLLNSLQYLSFSDKNTYFIFCIVAIQPAYWPHLFVCMCRRLRDGQRQFSQTWCFIARNTSEEDEKSAAAQAAATAATAATAEAVEAAVSASSERATVLIEAFALSLKG